MVEINDLGLLALVAAIGAVLYYVIQINKRVPEKEVQVIQETNMENVKDQLQRLEDATIREVDKREKLNERITSDMEKWHKTFEDTLKYITGTHTRGLAGENILKDILKSQIKSGSVVMNYRTNGKVVEFAYKLSDGKYIPIDVKMPDVIDLFTEFEKEKDLTKKKNIKKKILKKVVDRKLEAEKYLKGKDIGGKVIVAVPDNILDLVPEAASKGKENVILCGLRDVPFFLFNLKTFYETQLDQRDIYEIQLILNKAINLFQEIRKKVPTISRATVIIDNALDEINEAAIDGSGLRRKTPIKPKKKTNLKTKKKTSVEIEIE